MAWGSRTSGERPAGRRTIPKITFISDEARFAGDGRRKWDRISGEGFFAGGQGATAPPLDTQLFILRQPIVEFRAVHLRGLAIPIFEYFVEMTVALVTYFSCNIVNGKVGVLQQQTGVFHFLFGDDLCDLFACVFLDVPRQVAFAVVEADRGIGKGSRLVIGFNVAQYFQDLFVDPVIAVLIELKQFGEQLQHFAGQQKGSGRAFPGVSRQDNLKQSRQIALMVVREVKIVEIVIFPQKGSDEGVGAEQITEGAVLHLVGFDADVEDDRIGIDYFEGMGASQVHDADVAAAHIERFGAHAILDDTVEDANHFIKIVAVVRRFLRHPVADQEDVLLLSGFDALQLVVGGDPAVGPQTLKID